MPLEILEIKDSINDTTKEVTIHGIIRSRQDIPKCISHPFGTVERNQTNWKKVIDDLKVDRTVKSVSWINPGESSALKRLNYLKLNMNNYSLERNNPTLDKLSNLSPYFHFGHISAQKVAYEIKRSNVLTEIPRSD